MFRPSAPSAPFHPATPAAAASAPRAPAVATQLGAASAGFRSMYASLNRDIGGTVRNGFSRTSEAQLSSQAAHWMDALRARETEQAAQAERGEAKGASAAAFVTRSAADADRRAFLAQIMPHARRAGAAIGAAPELIAAHAALESGWGAKPLTNARGETTYNLFGIKATGGWRGASVAATTTEYYDGTTASKVVERFRAYPGYAGAFRDYAALLANSPRYAHALNAGDDAHAFARGLKRGGYATDPAYESKLVQVVSQVRGIAR